MKFSKYMDGQTISAYTKDNVLFEGTVRSNKGIKIIYNADGKWANLAELKSIRQTGHILNEEAEDEYNQELQKFTDYYDNAFDSDKVSKAADDIKDKIVKQYSDASDSNVVRTNKDNFDKDCLGVINKAQAEAQINAGNTTPDAAIEKLKKDNATDSAALAESLINSPIIQKAIIKEAKIAKDEDLNEDALEDGDIETEADYQQPEENFGLDDKRKKALDACDQMLDDGQLDKDQIIDCLVTDYEISNDEAKDMYDSMTDTDIYDTDWNNKDLTITADDNYDKVSDDVDSEIEGFLDDIAADKELDYSTSAVAEAIGKKLNLDGKAYFDECKSSPDAILKMAEDVKKSRLQEMSVKTLAAAIGRWADNSGLSRNPNDMNARKEVANKVAITLQSGGGTEGLIDDNATRVSITDFIEKTLTAAANNAKLGNARAIYNVLNDPKFKDQITRNVLAAAGASRSSVDNNTANATYYGRALAR